ncbi:hypothetical protein CW743_13255 [Staphylococcus shinii]|uniref:hypothetical protein n=1 Tax=Staphylococcus shinii TaxID=2912228 RepID=UPI000C33AF03|nr:hypothetical protein [Staphylococcus shinii]PKI11563.1 hypothetical protein CW743_13255 [Staphylococcus shinii]
MFLDIIGYVLGIGFVVFGISTFVLWLYEIYKIISKSDKKVSYKSCVYFTIIAAICGVTLIIMANVI